MHYYILAASKGAAYLYEVTDDSIKAIQVEGMPTSMADAWKGMERNDSDIGSHGPSGAGIFHGQGGAKDVTEQEEDGYYHMLASSLQKLLHNQPHPLVFAGVEEAFGMFRKFDASHRLINEYIRGNPDQLQPSELKDKADPIVREHVLVQNERFLEEYGNLMGTGRTSDDIKIILEAAKNGKVDLLLMAEGAQIREGDEELVGLAVFHTMEHHGRVALITAEHMPGGALVSAVLRH